MSSLNAFVATQVVHKKNAACTPSKISLRFLPSYTTTMATTPHQRKWCQIHIFPRCLATTADQRKWRQIRISVVFPQVKLFFDEDSNNLNVTVLAADGLLLRDSLTPPNSYVRIFFLPDKRCSHVTSHPARVYWSKVMGHFPSNQSPQPPPPLQCHSGVLHYGQHWMKQGAGCWFLKGLRQFLFQFPSPPPPYNFVSVCPIMGNIVWGRGWLDVGFEKEFVSLGVIVKTRNVFEWSSVPPTFDQARKLARLNSMFHILWPCFIVNRQ